MRTWRMFCSGVMLLTLAACASPAPRTVYTSSIPEPTGAMQPAVQLPERSMEPLPDPAEDQRADQVLTDFRTGYRGKGKPRLAIFLNRSLSDEIREWKTESRHVASGTGSRDAYMGSYYSGETAVYTQEHIELENEGSNVSQGGLWAFEDGFLQPFLETGSTVLDRATIMRLTALDHGQGDAYNPITVRRVEMEALKGNADIFVEVLILHNPMAPWGYEFKAMAKMVNTGQIIASTNSRNWNLESRGQSGGYFVQRSGAMPDAYDLSRELAVHLMESFLLFWQNNPS